GGSWSCRRSLSRMRTRDHHLRPKAREIGDPYFDPAAMQLGDEPPRRRARRCELDRFDLVRGHWLPDLGLEVRVPFVAARKALGRPGATQLAREAPVILCRIGVERAKVIGSIEVP